MDKFFKKLGEIVGPMLITKDGFSMPNFLGGVVTALLATWVF